jgi:sialate O-acetylesterase
MKPLLILLSFCSLAAAQDFHIATGLAEQQVLQRNSSNEATARVIGSADLLDGKQIEARVKSARGIVRPWAAVATVQNSAWSGDVKAIPMGGPYQIEFRAAGAKGVTIGNVLVGDLWVLAGQSNMEGVGDLVDLQQPDPKVHSFDLTDTWLQATEPLHTLVSAVDRVHWARPAGQEPVRLTGDALARYNEKRQKGAGLGLPFAVEMVHRTGVPIGLVPCAHGGTSMAQWDPALKDKAGDSLYGGMIRRVNAVGGKVAGVLWYQGESDANPTAAPLFPAKFAELVAAIRSDFAQPDLPFYYVQLGRHLSNQNEKEWNQIQEAQRLAEAAIPHSGMITAVNTSLDDGIHVSTQDQKRLGKQFANLALGKMKRGPRLTSIKVEPGVNPNTSIIRVTYSDVNGRLEADSRISGFSVHSAEGATLPVLFKAQFDPANGSAVLLYFQGKLPEGATLHYGYGKDPYCNVRDSADMGAPVFGPLPIE